MKIEPMKREDVIKAVEWRGPSRIPLVKWWGEGLVEQYGERLQAFDRYPEDVVFLFGNNPVAPRKMNLPWQWEDSGAYDGTCVIDAGLTVFRPVQTHTMDERRTAAEYGDRLTFLAGIDVQHTLQEKDPEGVREEVRFLIDTFDRPEGGMCIAAGNGIVSGTPFENIEAFLDEAVAYGEKHRLTECSGEPK